MANLKDHLVLETVLKRREQAEEHRIYTNIEEERTLQETRRRSRVPKLKTAASYIASTLNRKKSLNSLRSRLFRARNSVSGAVLLAVKIHISVHADNQIKRALHSLNLEKRYSAVLLKDTPENAELLRIADPFITYGPADEQTVTSLIRKRGRVLQKGKETLLKDNTLVEEALGQHGLICVDDLIHELTHPTDLFDLVRGFLRPFQLNLPQKKFKKTAYAQGGDFGCRGEKIRELIEEMN